MLLEGKPFYEIAGQITDCTAARDTAFELLDALESWFRDLAIIEYDFRGQLLFHTDRTEELRKRSRLYQRSAIEKAVAAIEEARNDLNRNLNISYTIKNMILKMIA